MGVQVCQHVKDGIICSQLAIAMLVNADGENIAPLCGKHEAQAWLVGGRIKPIIRDLADVSIGAALAVDTQRRAG